MSHSFDFSGLNEKLFLLKHSALAAREYCKREQLVQGPIDYEDDWSMYYLRTHAIVSRVLIEIAANIRIAEDTCHQQDTYSDIRELDEICRNNLNIGIVHQGSFKLTLRESCNKIIHGTEYDLSIAGARCSKPYYPYNYWNGQCSLKGKFNNKPWHVEINVYDWCCGIESFMDELSRNID